MCSETITELDLSGTYMPSNFQFYVQVKLAKNKIFLYQSMSLYR